MSEPNREDDPEAARARPEQQLLFPTHPRSVCEEVGLDWWALLKLRDEGWLSFHPDSALQLNEAQDTELRFLAALVTGGCDPAMLQRLLSKLKKPYSYHIGQVYYDWFDHRWRLLPERSINPVEAISKWIEELKEGGEVETLQTLAGEIEAALAQLHVWKPGPSVE